MKISEDLQNKKTELAAEWEKVRYFGIDTDVRDLYKEGFDAAVPLAYAERDKMILGLFETEEFRIWNTDTLAFRSKRIVRRPEEVKAYIINALKRMDEENNKC